MSFEIKPSPTPEIAQDSLAESLSHQSHVNISVNYQDAQDTIILTGGPMKHGGIEVSSNINIEAGNMYFVDSTASRTLTLPANPSIGDVIQVFDAYNLAGTNNITLNSNGGKINGTVQDLVLDLSGAAASLIYTGSTYGWRVG